MQQLKKLRHTGSFKPEQSPRVRAVGFPGQLNPQSFCSSMGGNPPHNPTKLSTASRESPMTETPRPGKGWGQLLQLRSLQAGWSHPHLAARCAPAACAEGSMLPTLHRGDAEARHRQPSSFHHP